MCSTTTSPATTMSGGMAWVIVGGSNVLIDSCANTGDIYNTVHKFYKDSLNRELIMSEEFEQYSIDRLFNADKD